MRLNKFTLAALTLLSPLTFGKALTVCTDANPEGFDVVQYNSLVTTNASADPLMNRLVEYDAVQRKIVPSLAERWEISPDGLSYTFHLRKNVPFHNTSYFKPTRPLNTNDVIFSMSRMLKRSNPWFKTATNGYPHAQAMQWPNLIKRIVQIDNHRLRIELYKPDATFLPTLTMGFASIYSAEYASQLQRAGRMNEMNSKPIGTGPFVFRSFNKDSVVRYDSNPNYFGGKPKFDNLIYAITTDPAVRLQKLRSNECQISLSPKPQDVKLANTDKNLKVAQTPAFMTAFIALNAQHKPFDNQQVRQAINMAFDQQNYLKVVFDGTAQAADRPYPPNTWSYDKNLPRYKHDPAAAKALLAKAGYPNGFSTTIWVRPTGSVLNPNPKAGAELLQADLAKIGIKARIQVIEWGELIKRAKAGQHDILFMGWAGDNGDPDNFLSPQFSCAAVKGGTNFARYCNSSLDKLISDGKRVSNQAERSKYYQGAQKIIQEQALWVPLAYPTAFALTRSDVGGYQVSPFGRQDFSKVTLP